MGISPELFDDKAQLAHLLCPICFEVCQDPTTMGCTSGHVFCKTCILECEERGGDACPVCKEHNVPFVLNRSIITQQIRDGMKTQCTHNSDEEKYEFPSAKRHKGTPKPAPCTWTGTYDEYRTHKMVCKFVVVTCRRCESASTPEDNVILPRYKLSDHREFDCPKMVCSCHAIHLKTDVVAHRLECPDVVVTCPNVECSFSCVRAYMSDHESTCVHRKKPCPYRCGFHGSTEEIEKHCACSVELHLSRMQSMGHRTTVLRHSNGMPSKGVHAEDTWVVSLHGYKVQFQIYNASDSELRLSAEIMTGLYDSVLDWPFPYFVTAELGDRTPHVEGIHEKNPENTMVLHAMSPHSGHRRGTDTNDSRLYAAVVCPKPCHKLGDSYIVRFNFRLVVPHQCFDN